MSTKRIPVHGFIHSEVKNYSYDNNIRSLPTLFDGMKKSQRKIIYGILQRGENAKQLSLERLASHVAAVTDYHHGASSLSTAMVGMARTYPGTNNMNLLMPHGQFGSRLTDEPGAARYTETRLSPYFRQLFRKEDDIILENIRVDDEKIEPETYFPLLPMSLVNGAEGTGTGHACEILLYHPHDVRDACIKVLDGKKLPADTLVPWFRDFSGEIQKDEDTGQIMMAGELAIVNPTTIKITELPVGYYVDSYKDVLFDLVDREFIHDFEDESTEEYFRFVVKVPRSVTELDEAVLYQKFKLIRRTTENFTLWNEDGRLERFDSPEDILERFVKWRITKYELRRKKMIELLTEEVRFINEKLRFILFYLDNVDVFKNKKRDDLIQVLLKNKFVDYDDLLRMQIWKLTHDEIEKLKKDVADQEAKLEALKKDTAKDMYKRELKEFKYDPELGKPVEKT